MKPIAVVHWLDSSEVDQQKDFYDVLTLSRFVLSLNRQNLVSYTMMVNVDANIPTREPRSHNRGA